MLESWWELIILAIVNNSVLTILIGLKLGFLVASTSAVMYLTDTIRPHPLYNMTTSQNDICILRTQTLINFNANVGPVCLPFRYSTDSFLGDTVTLLGRT